MAGRRVESALAKHDYTLIKKVGEGSFGAAILVQHPSDRERDTKAIVKMIDISRANGQEKEDALKESQVLESLKHPYIVRYRESFHEEGWLCIVMDYCEGGDLSDRIKKTRAAGKIISQEQVLRWFTQSILALKYIHENHILHRDLKSGNFFLSRSGNIKMGDFGIAKVLECTAACAQTQIGTPYYLSPEICQGKPYGWGSDIWSMGCILYELCARRVPFDAPDLKSLIQRITRGPTPELPRDYSSGLQALLRELLDRDASRRPPASEILKRPIVQDMVRRMLGEVKGGDDKNAGNDRQERENGGDRQNEGAAEGSRRSRAASGRYADSAGTYERSDAVEYYSETHKEWLPATVTASGEDGRIQLNVKPNVWISLEIQSAKVRPRQSQRAEEGRDGAAEAAAAPPPSSGRSRPPRERVPSGGPARQPSAGPAGRASAEDASPGGPASPGHPASRRSASGAPGSRHGTPNRQSTPGSAEEPRAAGAPAVGVRQASPRREGSRAGSQDRRHPR